MIFPDEEILYYENFNVTDVITPVNIDRLNELLDESNYPKDLLDSIITGFRNGFDIGYRGKTTNIKRLAPNLRLRIGNEVTLWNKVIKEVKEK